MSESLLPVARQAPSVTSGLSRSGGSFSSSSTRFCPSTSSPQASSYSGGGCGARASPSVAQVATKRMTRSSLFIIVKYSIFVNWTLTGFWIIYNSTDYSMNAQVISEKLATNGDPDQSHLKVRRASVVYGLIAYTIFTSFMSFFGLVGVCYENLYLTIGLSVCYVFYTLFDAMFNYLMGVPFGPFLGITYAFLVFNCLSLIYLSFLIRTSEAQYHYSTSSQGNLSGI